MGRFLAAVLPLAAQLCLFGLGVQSFALLRAIPHRLRSSFSFSRGDEFGPIISDINSPDDFKEFVNADDRLAVIKVYADWCKTCRLFDIRYRKVASSWGERFRSNPAEETEYSNLVRFAQIKYVANEEMCKSLDATKVPYILIYKRNSGKLLGFACPPSKVQVLIDALHEYALPHTSEMEMEQILSQGAELVQGFRPGIQEGAGYPNEELSFEEFCIVHTRRKSC